MTGAHPHWKALAAGATAVIAGQQPGLFGGPLYGLYKAAAAVVRARQLRDGGESAVAVFWLASEDHDLDEANRLYLPVDEWRTHRLYRLPIENAGQSLDRVTIHPEHVTALREWCEASSSGSVISPMYPNAGETIASWTRRLIESLFNPRELMIVEPRRFAKALRDHRQEVVACRGALQEALMARANALEEAGFSLQLGRPDPGWSLFFKEEESGRRRRLPMEGTDATDAFAAEAERISSSVWTRPLAQQWLFPKSEQICGPGELAYMAQLIPAFGVLGLAPPGVRPRPSLWVFDEQDREDLQRLDLQIEDVLGSEGSCLDAGEILPPSWRRFLSELAVTDSTLRRPPKDLARAEKELAALRRQWRKSFADFEKALRARARKEKRDELARRHRLREKLYPRGRAQERIWSLASLAPASLSDFGSRLLDRMTSLASSPGSWFSRRYGTS